MWYIRAHADLLVKMIFDSIQWAAPSCTIIAGPSNSGKTSLLTKILIHKNQLFTTQNLKTILFYNQEQEIYKSWSDSGFINHSQQGIPSLSEFQDTTKFYSEGNGAIIIFDDLGSEISNNLHFFEHIFVVLSHHLNLTVFLVVHNLFEKSLRKISLNTNRFIITANYRDKSQIGFLSRQAFPKSKNFLGSVYNYILSAFPYGYLVLDFSQNRSEYLRISTRWFSRESIMVFTEQTSNCGGDPLKPFRCYHLIADNVFKLLNSNHLQDTCNNNNINKNSFEINTMEKNASGYTNGNKTLKQTDVLNNPSNEYQSDFNVPDLQSKSDNTAHPQSPDINTQHNQLVKFPSDVLAPAQPSNTFKNQIGDVKIKSKITPSKQQNKRRIKKIPKKIDRKDFESFPDNKNVVNEIVERVSVDTPNPKQSRFKSTSNKIQIQKNKFLRVKQNIFKDKNKIIPEDKPKKTDYLKTVPSFSKIFNKQKKTIISRDTPYQKKNEPVVHAEESTESQVGFKPVLTGSRKIKNTSIKTQIPQVTSENTTALNANTPIPTRKSSNDQINLKSDRAGVKRKPLKGLRSNIPPKITKLNRGEKRPPDATWDKPQRKKGKKYNLTESMSDYDMWRI